MADMNIETLNDVLQTLIDSREGYEKAADLADDHPAIKAQLDRRAQARAVIIAEFQNAVRALGGEPQMSGSVSGSMHHLWMKITSVFESDQEAALDAIEDGEEKLQEEIADLLKQHDLKPQAIGLLQKAATQAREGEAFADRMEDAL